MMMSSNGNIFRVTGSFWGESTGHRWIPLTKASDAELRCFFICAWTNGWANNRDAGDLGRLRAHYDVTVMIFLSVLWAGILACKSDLVLYKSGSCSAGITTNILQIRIFTTWSKFTSTHKNHFSRADVKIVVSHLILWSTVAWTI